MWGILINGAFKKRFKDTAFFINANSKKEKNGISHGDSVKTQKVVVR